MRQEALGIRGLCILLAVTLLSSCIEPPPAPKQPDKLVLQPIRYHSLAGWEADNHAEALVAFLKSCDAFMRARDSDANGQGVLLAPMSLWKATCRKASLVPPGDNTLAREFFEENFVAFTALNNESPVGLFTGYYTPMLTGATTEHRPYIYPVYGLPAEGAPSYSRQEIDMGVLRGHAPVLAFVDDPVRLFFMQVQGSGYIRMEDGSVLRVSYAGTNGRPYLSIGKVLVDRGIMQKGQVNMARLRQWLYDHPDQMWQIMWENPSYVFFRVNEGDVVGTQGVPLTPGRSLAVDMHYIPPGMPVFVNTLMPAIPLSPATIYRRLLVAQDTGAAIRGPVRGDVFFGEGITAEELAGNMKEGGQYTLLVPRPLAAALLSK